MPSVISARVEVSGLRIAYREAGPGDGPVLAILPGACDDSRSWRWQLDGLSDTFRVLVWDAPGCGESDDPPPHWRVDDFADAAAGWLERATATPAHVLGLSWGSTIAIALADRHPAVVNSLVLASAYAGWKGSLPPDEVEARLHGVIAATEQSDDDFAFPGVFGPAPPDGLVRELSATWATNQPSRRPAAAIATASAMAEADLRDALPRLRQPTLLLYGEADARSPVDSVGRALAVAIPGSSLTVIPGVGHVCNCEAPDEFNAAVRAFLAG